MSRNGGDLSNPRQPGGPNAWLDTAYEQLRAMAAERLRAEGVGHTLQPTALVHEAWLRLAGSAQGAFKDEAHFRAVAAHTMRQILIDHARRKKAEKRGGGLLRVTLDAALNDFNPGASTPASVIGETAGVDLLELDDAMERLGVLDERKLRVVELRFFGGLTMKQIGTALDISPKTAEADWTMARAWLRSQLTAAG
ncbi:MAG: sigma-70 family RNA polymerase sigma factor [Phycisphaeraceae bacterium]|nr:sigma-70 family RNA polymerase sigma factor [Phycisphaeraceae bacterium]